MGQRVWRWGGQRSTHGLQHCLSGYRSMCCWDAQNQSKAKELLKLSWDEVHLIQEKAVQRGLERRVAGELKHLGVDEKSFLKGHQYATILSDLDHPRVLDVARDRKEYSLGELLNKIPEPQRDNIEAVALDMWEPFINAVEQYLPQVDIVHV